MTTEEKRLILLKKLCAGAIQKDFAKAIGVNASYLSQIMTRKRLIGEVAAKNWEERLGLIPGVLVHPQFSHVSEATPVASLYLPVSRRGGKDHDIDPSGDHDETSVKRTQILLALIGKHSQVDFCSYYNLSPAYVSQLVNGHRAMGGRTAKSFEEKIGLVPGTLEHPQSVQVDTPEQIVSLFKDPDSLMRKMSSAGRLLLHNLEAMIKLGALSEAHISTLSNLAYQLALPNLDEIHEGKLRHE